MDPEEFLKKLTFKEYEEHSAEEQGALQADNNAGPPPPPALSREQLEQLFESFKVFAIRKNDRLSSTPPVTPAIADTRDAVAMTTRSRIAKDNVSFDKALEALGDLSIDEADKRLYLLWNIDGILDDSGNIKQALKTFMTTFKPVGILLNELLLKYNDISDSSIPHSKLNNLIDGLGYSILTMSPSYKRTKWQGGSAILIRNDKINDYSVLKDPSDPNKDLVFKGEDGFELIGVMDDILQVPLYCFYAKQDKRRHHDHHELAAIVNNLDKGVAGGDLNTSLFKFKQIFTNLKDCLNESWMTHCLGPKNKPSKIDFLAKVESDKSILVEPLEPLQSDNLNSHFPILFTVSRDTTKLSNLDEKGGSATVKSDEEKHKNTSTKTAPKNIAEKKGDHNIPKKNDDDSKKDKDGEWKVVEKRRRGRPHGSKNKPKN